mgnify:FL=1
MALALHIFTVATFGVAPFEFDVNGTTSVFESTSFHLIFSLGHLCLGVVDTSNGFCVRNLSLLWEKSIVEVKEEVR